MIRFATIHDRALDRKGAEVIADRLGSIPDGAGLAESTDDRWLSMMAKCVFAAGFRWRVVQAKWPGFEEAFIGFAPHLIARLSKDLEQALCQDRRIIRNPQKVRATIENAQFVRRVAAEHGGFGPSIAAWRSDDVVRLWSYLKNYGARLGGHTGPRILRLMGKDTFILTDDVTYGLTEAGLMTAKPTSKKGRQQAQAAFGAWQNETGRPMAHLSMILAMSVDRPRTGA